jgi:pimeloyl-ACP methyl ester carboxylesterase
MDPRGLPRLSVCFRLLRRPPSTAQPSPWWRCLAQPSREPRLQLTLPRTFLVGAHTVEAETASGMVADWEYVRGLSDSGVQLLVVPDAGHGMMADNREEFARALAQALGSR